MSFVKQFVTVLFAAALLLSSAPRAYGQATTGELTGRVTDAASAVIPGVTVTLRSPDTGLVRTAVTNDTGEYFFLLIPPGRYTVAAELAGFKKVERPDVLINVGTRQTLSLQLEVGALSEVLVVSGATPLIETTRSDLGGVITPSEITNLPLLNRTFANLSIMMPEARPAGELRPDEDTGRQLRDERRRRPAARRQRRRRRQQGQRRRQPAAELRLRVDPGVPGPAAPLDRRERPRRRRRRQRDQQVGHERPSRVGCSAPSANEDLAAKDFFQERGGGQADVRALGIRRLGRRTDRARQAVLLRRARAVRRAEAEKRRSGRTPISASRLVPGSNPVPAIPTPTTTRC